MEPACALHTVVMPAKVVDGAFIRRARAELVGRDDLSGRDLARRLADQMDGWFALLGASLPPGWALLATGGYAGGLLAPGSDVDVVLLHPERVRDADVRAVAEPLWYPMWDAGLKLSPAAHSIKSLLSLASSDLETATSILRVRVLAGREVDVAALRVGATEQWHRRAAAWLKELRTASEHRWARAGEVASLLEPDLKDGRGGMRDHDTIRWALATGRPEIAGCLEIPVGDLASPAELLFAVRCELHRVTGKTTNVLLLQDQDAVAAAMGFADSDVLMLRVSAAARAIDWACERFWWRVDRLGRTKGRADSGRVGAKLFTGVTVVDDEVEVDLREADADQSLLFRVAAAAARDGYAISRRSLLTLSSIAGDEGERWTQRTRQAMISLLGAGQHLVSTIESLERYDLFSRMLPEWRHVRSRPQRNAFHTYTVDRHLLQTVVNANEHLRDVARPDLLLVGALLHDIGKGYPGDHTEVGTELVDAIGTRMGFPETDVDVIRSLVEHHLLLPETATRRDLEDPRTAENVATLVGDRLRLSLLRALVEADSRATGPSAWSSWKESLIDQLVRTVDAVLAGQTPPARTTVPDDRFNDVLDLVRADGQVHTRHEPAGDFDRLFVAAPDHPGLFAQITGTLTVHGVDVVGAEAWTSADGIAIDEFQVQRANGTTPDWRRVEHDLRGVVTGAVDIGSRIEQRIRTYARSRRRAVAASPPRLEVLVTNDASQSATMIDVRAPDSIGVLYRLASQLSAYGLDIRSAKVATLGHEVVDVFYVERPGPAPARQIPQAEHGDLSARLKHSLLSG
jgi:[protein-PII] uridylyltransferase